jgi:hypothetical protein
MTTDETRPEDFKNPGPSKQRVKGWGTDADSANDPTYPMKMRTDEEQLGYTWKRPEQQYSDTEILHSVERKNTPAVFGTTLPPKGLSGKIRRQAFKYSESSYGRWLPLALADRVDVLEGIAEDFRNGYIPDLWKELGLGAAWKYNRKGFLIKTAVATVAVTALLTFLVSDRKSNK